MIEMPGSEMFQRAIAAATLADAPPTVPPAGGAASAIGVVFAIAGSSSRILLDRSAIATLEDRADPILAAAGQVGS